MLGFYKDLKQKSKWVKISLLSSLAQCIVISILEGIVLSDMLSDLNLTTGLKGKINEIPRDDNSVNLLREYNRLIRNQTSLPVYFALFIFAQLFQFYLCLDATLNQNTMQIIVLSCFNFLLCTYGGIQYYQTTITTNSSKFQQLANEYPDLNVNLVFNTEIKNITLAIIILLAIFSISFAFVAHKLYQEYGWTLYKRIGADVQMKKMYKIYHVFVMSLKLDVFFFLMFSVQLLILVISPQGTSQVLIHVFTSLLIGSLLLVLSFWSVKNENQFGVIAFIIGCMGTLCYFIYQLVLMHISAPGSQDYNPEGDLYFGSRIFLTSFATLCIMFNISTMVIAFLCYRNFNRGLKYLINESSRPDTLSVTHLPKNDRAPQRWSLE